jgi:hypothetical protein
MCSKFALHVRGERFSANEGRAYKTQSVKGKERTEISWWKKTTLLACFSPECSSCCRLSEVTTVDCFVGISDSSVWRVVVLVRGGDRKETDTLNWNDNTRSKKLIIVATIYFSSFKKRPKLHLLLGRRIFICSSLTSAGRLGQC